MKNFMSSLNRASDVFSNESVLIRNNEVSLNKNFAGLQATVRKTLIVRPKPNTHSSISPKSPINPHPSRFTSRSAACRSKSENASSKPSSSLTHKQTAFSTSPDKQSKKSFPTSKTNAAERIYKSPATQKMYEDILCGYADYLSNPTPAGAIQYESQIDPVLHVGSFDYNEVNRLGKISPLYSPP